MNMKRFAAAVIAAASLTAPLTSCGEAGAAGNSSDGGTSVPSAAGQASSTEGGAKTTEITFWYSWTDTVQKNNLELTEEFNSTVGKEHGVTVTAEYQGSYDDLHQKLQAAYVAGATPAVTVMEIASMKTFAQNGVLESLTPYIQRDNVDMEDFQAGLMKNSYVDGQCYGLPYLRSTPIMYMNLNILEEAGLDPKGPDTWDELGEYARTIKEKTGKYGITQNTYIWTYEAFMMERGSSVLNEDETATNFGDGATKDIIQFFQELSDEGAAHLMSAADEEKLNIDIMNQNAAIWFGSTGSLANLRNIAADNGFEIGTAFIPKEVQYGVPTGGCNLIMTTNISEDEKEGAWQFIKWMTETEQTIKASINTGYLPSRISAADDSRLLALYEEIPQYKVALDQLQYSTGRPMNPGYNEAQKALTDALDAIWINGQDMDAALSAAKAKMDALLTE